MIHHLPTFTALDTFCGKRTRHASVHRMKGCVLRYGCRALSKGLTSVYIIEFVTHAFAVADDYVHVRKCIRSAAAGSARHTCFARTMTTCIRIFRIPCLSKTHAMSVTIRFDCYVFASPLTERAERCRSRVSNVKWATH